MKTFKYLLFFFVLSLSLVLPQSLSANEQGFGVRRVSAYPTARGVSRIGKVTGEGCRSDHDCIIGCQSGQPDDLKCLTIEEASNECVSPEAAPDEEFPCACLSDVQRCGFLFMKNKVEQAPDHVMLLTQPEPPRKPKTVKKTQHKKTAHKKTTKKKAAKSKPAATSATPAPTPLTEPAHDSGK